MKNENEKGKQQPKGQVSNVQGAKPAAAKPVEGATGAQAQQAATTAKPKPKGK